MPINANEVQWDAPAAPVAPVAINPNLVRWDDAAIPSQRQPAPNLFQQLGRGAASLADVTVGGVLPGVVEYGAYPFLRAAGQSPEQASTSARGMASAIDQPFGKAFGVTDTPEYQNESTRRIFEFVGQNFDKGADWISSKTGLPKQDVSNMMMTLGPVVAKGVRKGIVDGVPAVADLTRNAVQQAEIGVKLPFDKQLQARRDRLSAESYERGPQIDAALDAQRLGIALNPVDIDPKSVGAKISTTIAGERGVAAIEKANIAKVNEIARKEMGIPDGTSLAGADAFNKARAAVAEPYGKIAQIPVIQADDAVRQSLNGLRQDKSLIGGEATAGAIDKLVDSALEKVDAGLTGKDFLANVSNLRASAKRIYKNPNASPKQIAIADANLAIANTLEGMIEKSIFDPRLVSDFRAARQQMARIYGYEAATDFNTGVVNPSKIARLTSSDNAITGDIASLGRIAGNYPSVFKSKVESAWQPLASRLTRAGVGGTTGALAGYQMGGFTGSAIGTALGALGGDVASSMMAKRIASPGYQQGLSVRDFRMPITNQMAAQASTANLPALFDPKNALVQPTEIVGYAADGSPITADQAFSRPNWTYGRPEAQVTPVRPGGPAALPAPSPEGTLNALRTEDARRAQMSRTLGQQAEAEAAAVEAAAGRRPTSGEVILDFDPVTGKFREASQGVKGATPETFTDFGTDLTSAARKVAEGRRFDLSATEKIAWEKNKVDLAEIAPGFKTMTDKAITERMMDRQWVQDTMNKARDKADAFAKIAENAKTTQARQKAAADRERMLDLLESLESQLSTARPVPSKSQGPKTREFNRNRLRPNEENQNAFRIELNNMAPDRP